MATQKELFAISLLDIAHAITDAGITNAPEIVAQYFDLGYDGAGGDPIIDADLTNFNDLTAADVTNIITAFQQIANYFDNAAVTQADYASSYNAVKYSQFG